MPVEEKAEKSAAPEKSEEPAAEEAGAQDDDDTPEIKVETFNSNLLALMEG